MRIRQRQVVTHLRSLLNIRRSRPDEVADVAVSALERRLSDGACATYQQRGRGLLLLDLHELPSRDIQLHYVTAAMLPKLEVREHLFAEVKTAIGDYDPSQEFLVLVWQPASMFFCRLKRLNMGTA